MPFEENQMGLFEGTDPAPVPLPLEPVPLPLEPMPEPSRPPAKPARKKLVQAPPVVVSSPATKKISGLVPDGDVRLTANIRQDLHLKLKISSAYRRTTIGEIIEELIEKHL